MSIWRKVAALSAAALILGACTSAEEPAAPPTSEEPAAEAPAPEIAPAALIIAQGGLGDESYNDLAFAGFQSGIAEAGIEGTPIESDDVVAQGEQTLRRAAEGGYGLILDLEYSHGEIIGPIAADFPDVSWAIYNLEVAQPNVASVIFQEQEGSYLAGALAARMTSVEGNDRIDPTNKVIGVIGGVASAGIDKFLVGFVQGAKDTDPEVEVLVSYSDNFGDPAIGQALAEAMFERGADIVYHVAGGTGAGVIQAAVDANRYAIGVDTDQDGLAPGSVLTSMVKRVDVATADLIARYARGEYPGGQTVTYGLAEGGVGLSEFKFTKDAIPAEFLTEVEDLKARIISGEIEVWNVVTDGYPDFFQN